MSEDTEKRNFVFDLILTLLLVDLSMVFVLVPPFNQTPLRVVFALPLLLFLPGYALICTIFPKKSELSGIERFTLSIGLSIAITVFDGFAISVTPWRFRPMPIVFSLSAITTFFVLVATLVRLRISSNERYYFDFSTISEFIRSIREDKEPASDIEKALIIALIGSIIIASGMFIYAKLTFKEERFTALYILGKGGKAENYPTELYLLEPTPIIVGVENYEHALVNYTLQVKLGGYLLHEQRITLKHGEKWEDKVNVTPKHVGKRMKLEFLLYKENNPSVYRSVHLWVNSVVDYDNLKRLRKYMLSDLPAINNSDMELSSGWTFERNTGYFRGFFTKYHILLENSTLCGYIIDNQTGLPVPNARISISNHYGYERSASSDESGYYELKTIADHFWIRCSAKGYKPSGMIEVDVSDGQTVFLNISLDQVRPFNMTIEELASLNATIEKLSPEELPHIVSVLKGYVIDEITGLPVPNASVKVTNEYGFVQCTKTNESGYFEVKIISGKAVIEVRAKGYAANRTVYRVASAHELNILLPPLASTVRGYVYDSKTGKCIPNAYVTAYGKGFSSSTRTNESGYFEIKTISGGIVLEVSSRGYFRHSEKINASIGENNVSLVLDPIPPPAMVRGYVVYNGVGIPGVEVVVEGKERKSTVTGYGGYFELEVIPGNIQVYAVPKAYMKEDVRFEARSGQVVNLVIELDALPESTYQISFPSKTKLAKGQYGGISQEIVSEGGLAALSFKVSDSYRSNRSTSVFKQVLLNGIVVWEDNIAGDEDWQEIKVPIVLDKGVNKLTLRVYAKQGFNGPLNVWWDDVKLIPFSELIKDKTTYFKILNANGEEKNYPTRLYLGIPAEVIAVVENHEYEKASYTLEVRLGGVLLKKESFTLEHGEKWEKRINFTPSIIGSLLKLEFLLYKDGLDKPYRYFYLYVSSEIDYDRLEVLENFVVPISEIVNYDMESAGGWMYEGENFTARITNETSFSPTHSYEIGCLGHGYASIHQNFTVSASPANVVISFCVKDSYTFSRTGYLLKQVLLNDEVIWEDDVAGDEGWMCVKVPITLYSKANKLTLRVYGKSATPVEVWWDDVRVEPITNVLVKTTYFKILNANGEEKNYPTRLYLGIPAEVIAVVENHEYEKASYTLEVRLGGVLLKKESFTLEHGEKWEKRINFTPSIIGSLLKLEFLLYKDGLDKPYRYFYLYVSSEIDYRNLEAAKKYEPRPLPEVLNGGMESYGGWSFERKGTFVGSLSKEAASGNYSYSIKQVGRCKAGDYAAIHQLIRLRNPGVAFITFSAKDDYDEANATGLYKQVLIDGRVIWEDDIAGREGWQKVRIPVYFPGDCRIMLRVYAKDDVEDFGARVYWDDIYIKPLTGG